MIAKHYSTTIYVEALKALYKRLPKDHQKFFLIQNEYHRKVAGDIGEEVVMKVLEQLQLPYKFYAFHNVTLYAESLFQIDILIISPYYALIFEVKNIKGEISLTVNPQQLVRKLQTGEINVFDSPVPQLAEYEYQLDQIFQQKKVPLPIHSAIVMTFNSQIIMAPNDVKLLTTKEIKPFLRSLKTTTPLISNKELENLKQWILMANKDFLPFPLSKHFSISPDTLLMGVICSNCRLIGMKKIRHNWFCPRCKIYNKKAYEQALKDYFLIYKSTMSNNECQQFLKLNNKHEATRILKHNMLIKTGQSRNTKYILSILK